MTLTLSVNRVKREVWNWGYKMLQTYHWGKLRRRTLNQLSVIETFMIPSICLREDTWLKWQEELQKSKSAKYCWKHQKAVPHFLINSQFICLIRQFATMLQLTPTHNSWPITRKHTQHPVVSRWNSALYGMTKHVPHTCLLSYVWINKIPCKCQSNWE